MTGLSKFVTRLLPPDEWYKLKETEADPAYLHFDPQYTNVVVVEKEGSVVACWVLFPVYHAECVWIRKEDQKNPVVAGRLVKGMKHLATELGLKNLVTHAIDEEVKNLLTKHLEAKKIPGESFIFPVKLGT